MEHAVRVNCGEKPRNRKNTVIVCILAVLIFFILYRAFVVYVPEVYVCRHMARDQEVWLEDQGFDVKIYRGVTKIGDEGHVWCAINVSGVWTSFDSIGFYPFVPSLLYYNISIFEDYSDYLVFKNS